MAVTRRTFLGSLATIAAATLFPYDAEAARRAVKRRASLNAYNQGYVLKGPVCIVSNPRDIFKNVKAGRLLDWDGIVDHHTETDRVHSNGSLIGAEDFEKTHVEKGMFGVAYHFVIRADGSLQATHRWLNQETGGHTADTKANGHLLGISLVDNYNVRKPDPIQIRTLFALHDVLMGEFGKDMLVTTHIATRVNGAVKSTTCPGKNFCYAALESRYPISKAKVPLDQFPAMQIASYPNLVPAVTGANKERIARL